MAQALNLKEGVPTVTWRKLLACRVDTLVDARARPTNYGGRRPSPSSRFCAPFEGGCRGRDQREQRGPSQMKAASSNAIPQRQKTNKSVRKTAALPRFSPMGRPSPKFKPLKTKARDDDINPRRPNRGVFTRDPVAICRILQFCKETLYVNRQSLLFQSLYSAVTVPPACNWEDLTRGVQYMGTLEYDVLQRLQS